MKIIFVDAENVGFKGLEAIDANIIDKVFVFSRVESIQLYSKQKLFICLSDYPEGTNQADFYIISYLSRVLSSVSSVEKETIELILYSNDVSLIEAFKFQCQLLGAKSRNISFNHDKKAHDFIVKAPTSPKLQPLSKQIFNMLSQPKGLFDIQTSLKLTKPIFNQAVNELIKQKKIQRQSKNGKNWVQIKHKK